MIQVKPEGEYVLYDSSDDRTILEVFEEENRSLLLDLEKAMVWKTYSLVGWGLALIAWVKMIAMYMSM